MTKLIKHARLGGGRKLYTLLAVVVASAAIPLHAATWTCYPELTNGMTGPEQITNALTRLASGDTILVEPGIYDFTGISMRTDTFESGGNTYVITNHLYCNIAFTLKGNSSGHWDDAIVFKGNGRCCDVKGFYKYTYFNNVTFDGFDCQRFPCGGSYESRGGALRLEDYSLCNVVSNCVFRNCSAYIGGAVNGGLLIDCLCTNNYASSNGGVGSNTRFESCRVVYNRAGGSYGASYSQRGVINSYFEGNSGAGCGAFAQGSDFVCSNNTFVANVSRDNGGAINLSGTKDVIDCTFIGNVATNAGGAIYISSSTGAKIRGCTFISNSVARVYSTDQQYGGGAIYSKISSAENTISNCTFIGNWTAGTYGGATANGVYEDCTFISNRAEGIAGGACFFPNNATGAVLRCVFLDNVSTNGGALSVNTGSSVAVIDCVFTNNFVTRYGGAVNGQAVCSNCTFAGNLAILRGGAISGAETVDCVFRGNRKGNRAGTETHYEYGGGCAYLSRLVRCDFTDAAFWQCSLVDCSIHDVVNSIAPCIFYEENWATNCLVSGCTDLSKGLFYRYLWRPTEDRRGAVRGSMVNCTFADNSVNRADTFFVANSHKTNEFDFVNCIFHNNKVTGAKVADLSGGTLEEGCVTLQNCIYGVSDGTLAWENKGGNIVCADPKFAKDIRDGRYPYYMPKSESVAINAGLTQDWMSAASDLSGTNRVLGARVDIGCYESYIPPFGFIISVR